MDLRLNPHLELDPAAARLLVERMGPESLRLRNELERLALWAGESGQVTAADLEEMIADTSEAAVWTLSDAVIEGDARTALRWNHWVQLPNREATRRPISAGA